MGRERGYPLGARGSPCDADYEDGSVPLQLPLSCADHLHRSAKRRLSPPGDRVSIEQPATPVGELSDIISARRIVVRSAPAPSSPAPSAHRYAAVGLDRSARPNEEASVPLMEVSVHLACECTTGRPSQPPLLPT